MSRIVRAINGPPARGLYDLAASLGAPLSLKSIGMKREDLEQAADLAVKNPYYNPRPLIRADILTLLQSAFEGDPPSSPVP
jgi:maleylacetate reductase